MKYVAKARKEIGTRTVFNILGPLANPAETDYILLGVYSDDLIPVMAKVLCGLGIRHAMVVHGEDGFDEISISAPTKVAEIKDGGIFEYTITPEQFGLPMAEKEEDAGCALYVVGQAGSIGDGVALAAEMIDSGAALAKLEELKQFTNALA